MALSRGVMGLSAVCNCGNGDGDPVRKKSLDI